MTLSASFSLYVEHFTLPADSPHQIVNFNSGWRFLKADATNAEQVSFDDSKWTDVALPHTYNDTDSYTDFISHSGGDRHPYAGPAWYRKRFAVPAAARNGKVFLEVEGLKQAARFWLNGQPVGKYENGVTPLGVDLSAAILFGAENVLAVRVDNSNDYKEESTSTSFQWMGRAFNPNYGGLNKNIRLHLTGKIYQTLPLYENLQTAGIYIYASDFDVSNHTCRVNVESQVRNESGGQQSVVLNAVVVDGKGNICARIASEASDLGSGRTEVFKAAGKLSNASFWSDDTPSLYDVYCRLTVKDKVVDVQKITTGFRKAEFKGGAGTGGLWLNDRFVWLTGYAQRSVNEWAGLGQAYPDWMHDYNAQLIRSTHANYVRWMHIAPQPVDVRACDRVGVFEICPAGDKEKDVTGRQWEQRKEVMRDTMIYFRNSPSILFWEAGNNSISPEHMQEMVSLRKQFDPNGGRAMGCRTLNAPDCTPIAEYFGVMIGQDPRTDKLTSPTNMFRAYSAQRRDRVPIIEAEDFRDEAARRFWDDFSPPHFGFKKGPNDTYSWNSETFCLAAAGRYHEYMLNRISNPGPAHSKWSGYASIYWSDSNADGRQDSSEVCRVSGKVDSVRLPKQAYYVYRVMQSATPDVHIIGHWNYPTNTVKTIYVAANHCDGVELFVNGKSTGICQTPTNGYIFAFPQIQFQSGRISAAAQSAGRIVARHEIESAGSPARLKLTPYVGPNGFLADGSDVAFFDVEVVDSEGRRCPTDEGRVDFKLDGPAIWRGGYNSGKPHSVNNLWLDTECGINRVAIRSTDIAGAITLSASRVGVNPAAIKIQSKPIERSRHDSAAGHE
jgi:beta-galactosidase